MPYLTTNAQPQHELYYEDFGQGQPIILIHGWPLNGRSWEPQVQLLLDMGYRVIAYDRKGFGRSGVTDSGYDYDGLAADLHELITQLSLQNVILTGFSMGGGEVVRYITNYGNDNVDKIILISSIIPLVKKKEDNPDGVPPEDLKDIMSHLRTDRVTFMKSFVKKFYNDSLLSGAVTEEQVNYDWNIAANASPLATIKTAQSWSETDFRPELQNIRVPALIVHGDADKVAPIKSTGYQAAAGIADNQFVIVEGGSHGLNVTHTQQLNVALLKFLSK